MNRILKALIFVGIAAISQQKKKVLVALLILMFANPGSARECVVLLHGLARVSNSMGELEAKLTQADFSKHQLEYFYFF